MEKFKANGKEKSDHLLLKYSTEIKFVLKTIITFALIYWVITRGSLNLEVVAKAFQPVFFFPIVIFIYLTFVVNTYRWVLIMKSRHLNISLKEALPLTYIGQFFNFAIPGGVSGDVIKGYYLLKGNTEKKLPAATSIIVDRYIGLISMILFGAFSLLLNTGAIEGSKKLQGIAIFIVLLLVFLIALTILMISEKTFNNKIATYLVNLMPFSEKIRSLQKELYSYRHNSKILLSALSLSFVSQLSTILTFYVSGLAMGYNISFASHFFVIPVALVITAIPVSPGGIGFGQAVYLLLYNLTLGSDSSIGPDLITSLQGYSLLWGFVGAYYYFRAKKLIVLNNN
ncbi:MAG: flippase-like domain-containing protein [Bdellovibrionales bacterium]|nr:flippase-like domain-containing protein [Bdellovibrionales bacterium]